LNSGLSRYLDRSELTWLKSSQKWSRPLPRRRICYTAPHAGKQYSYRA